MVVVNPFDRNRPLGGGSLVGILFPVELVAIRVARGFPSAETLSVVVTIQSPSVLTLVVMLLGAGPGSYLDQGRVHFPRATEHVSGGKDHSCGQRCEDLGFGRFESLDSSCERSENAG